MSMRRTLLAVVATLLATSFAHAQSYENLAPLNDAQADRLAIETNIEAGISTQADKPYATTPVDRFAAVDKGLYRGGAPASLEAMKALKKLGVKTIINLQGDKKKIAQEAAWAKQLGMNHVSIPLSGFWAPHKADVAKVQAMMKDKSLRPLFFHCAHGRERTGLQAALYRYDVQGWSAKKAYDEWIDFGFRTITFAMKDYFESHTHTDL